MYQTLQTLFRQKDTLLRRTLGDGLMGHEMVSLFTLCLALLMGYGLLIGASHSVPQALVSCVKLPVLFLLTSAICFPTLYMFLSYLGIRQGLRQLLGLMLVSLTFISLVLTAFAPVTFFFLITTGGYAFFKFINIIVFSVAGFIGIRLFYGCIRMVIQEGLAPLVMSTVEGSAPALTADNRPKARLFIFLWAIMFSVIGTQLSFTLSPFFGDPGQPFIWFTDEKGNFFLDLINTITSLNR